MENASKALIIAGAILIAILLISVGILIINSTGSVTDQVESQADAMAIQIFNGQFTSYEGKNKTLTQIRQLANIVRASNANNNVKVTLYMQEATSRTAYDASKLKYNKKYEVKFEYYDTAPNKGYIQNIIIVIT